MSSSSYTHPAALRISLPTVKAVIEDIDCGDFDHDADSAVIAFTRAVRPGTPSPSAPEITRGHYRRILDRIEAVDGFHDERLVGISAVLSDVVQDYA